MTSTNLSDEETRDAGFDQEAPEAVQTGRNIVCVIGINDYQHWRKLGNAASDAQGIRTLFVETFGFEEPVPHLFDAEATKEAITYLVEDQLHTEVKEGDTLVLFFAGHGHTQINRVGKRDIETGFIVPVEAQRDRWSDCIRINEWLEAINTLPAQHILVVLDACHSGFGIGQVMKIFRDAVRYEQDLVRNVSRKVFTSARRDQLALDGGPVEGHSLFTGTLIDGLNWGKADIDGNGLITGSELGLYVQQQVGQHSDSKQTPDFGSFGLDERGEVVIKLGSNSFDALKAQAFAALQGAKTDQFAELVQQLVELRPESPQTLYLRYRLAFLNGNISLARQLAERLYKMDFKEDTLPISRSQLWEAGIQISFWYKVLSLPSQNSALKIELLEGQSQDDLQPKSPNIIGEIDKYTVQLDSYMGFKITNISRDAVFVYLFQVTSKGEIEFIPVWRSTTTPLAPNESRESYLFSLIGEPGPFEMRFCTSPTEIPEFLSPPASATRGVVLNLNITDEELSHMKIKFIQILQVLPNRPRLA